MWRHIGLAVAAAAATLMVACTTAPLPPDWQVNARAALDRSVAAYLAGNTRVAAAEFDRARAEIARTGRADLMARAELMRCAVQVASLVFDACDGFEKLRPDAAAPERAYADYLAARAPSTQIALLPEAQRAAAAASAENAAAALRTIDDPQARLIAAGVLLRAGRAHPDVLALAVETASAQGWRRPLLAWLKVQLLRADKAGDVPAADQLRRRIALVEEAK